MDGKLYQKEGKHIFTAEELLAQHKARSDNAAEIENIEQQMKDLKFKKESLTNRNKLIDHYGRDGFMFRMYDCRAEWNVPKVGMVIFVRLDNGDYMEEREMSMEEMAKHSQMTI